jgi:CBS domain-containing protein
MPDYVIPSGRLLTTGDFLDVAVRKAMSPGIVSIAEGATLDAVYHALVRHRIHALLVVGSKSATPLGWATAGGLLAHADEDRDLVSARDAITEEPHEIRMQETVRDAITMLSELNATHLVVVEEKGGFPVGTISELDVAAFLGSAS